MPDPNGNVNTNGWDWQSVLPTLGVPAQSPADNPNSMAQQAVAQEGAYRGVPFARAGGQYATWNMGGGVRPGADSSVPFNAPAQPNYGVTFPFQPAPMPDFSQGGGIPFTAPGAAPAYNGWGLMNAARGYGNRTTPYSNGGQGGGGGPQPPGGMSGDEFKWAQVAAKMGLDWNVTKNVYMNPSRNGSAGKTGSVAGDVFSALNRQMDDKLWGDAAWRAGILNGNPDHDNQVWVDHYNAGGNQAYDPMAGHNDAWSQYKASQDALTQQQNQASYGQNGTPSWYP